MSNLVSSLYELTTYSTDWRIAMWPMFFKCHVNCGIVQWNISIKTNRRAECAVLRNYCAIPRQIREFDVIVKKQTKGNDAIFVMLEMIHMYLTECLWNEMRGLSFLIWDMKRWRSLPYLMPAHTCTHSYTRTHSRTRVRMRTHAHAHTRAHKHTWVQAYEEFRNRCLRWNGRVFGWNNYTLGRRRIYIREKAYME